MFNATMIRIRGTNNIITEYTPDGEFIRNVSTTDTYTIKILDVYKFIFKIIDTKVYCDVYKKENHQKDYKLQYQTKQLTLPEKYRITEHGIIIIEHERELFYASVFDNYTKKICKKKVEKCLNFDDRCLW